MIETDRLVIRPLASGEARALLRLWGDPANERIVGDYPLPESLPESVWGVFERASGALVGDCELFEADGELELAYGLAREHWGKGYGTEAAAACVRHAFERLGVDRVVADIHRGGNPRSERVLEKVGFRRWRETPEKTIYAVTRSGAAPSGGGATAGSTA